MDMTCRCRVVRTTVIAPEGARHTVTLRDESGLFSLWMELEKAGFAEGDLVEVRLVERNAAETLNLPDHPWGPYGSPRPKSKDVLPTPKAA